MQTIIILILSISWIFRLDEDDSLNIKQGYCTGGLLFFFDFGLRENQWTCPEITNHTLKYSICITIARKPNQTHNNNKKEITEDTKATTHFL